jgi:outer membrane protein assembly factor BamB
MMRVGFAFALAALALSACGGKEKEVLLQGERITILSAEESLSADRSAAQRRVSLPNEKTVTSWGQVGGNAAHTVGHAKLAASVNQVWSRSLGAGSGKDEQIFHQPVAVDGVIYTLLPNGSIRAVEAAKGKSVWRTQIKGIKESSHFKYSGGLAVSDDILIATTGAGQAIGFDRKTGKELWRRDVLIPTRAAPIAYAGRVFVIGHNNQVFALKASDGSVLWTHNGIAESLSLLTAGAAAADGNIVVVPYSSGEIYALNAQNGTYFWHDALALNVKADPFSALVDVTAPPVIDGEVLFAVNHNGRLGAFSVAGGERLWEVELSATQQPWVAGDLIFITTENNRLAAISREDGKIRWVKDLDSKIPARKKKKAAKRFWGAPILAGGRVLVTSDDGFAFAVNPLSGELIRIGEIAKNIRVAPLVIDDTLIFLTQDGRLIAYR